MVVELPIIYIIISVILIIVAGAEFFVYQKNRKKMEELVKREEENNSKIFEISILNKLGEKIGYSLMDLWKAFEIDSYSGLDLCSSLYSAKIKK